MERLAKAGDVEEKVAQAETAEQRLKALEREHQRLGEIIHYAATRQMLGTRQQMLEDEGRRMLLQSQELARELAEVERERRLLGEQLSQTSFRKELLALEERLNRSRTGAGRPSTRWLEPVVLPFPVPVPLRELVDRLLDGMQDFGTWRLGRGARKRHPDSGTAAEVPSDDHEAGVHPGDA